MDRGALLLQGLRTQLGCWFTTIQRGAGLTSLEVVDGPDGAFTLLAEWKTKEGKPEFFSCDFTRELVFGRTAGGSPLAYRVQKRACDYAKDFMREILARRGAL